MKKFIQITSYVLLSALVIAFVCIAVIKKDFAPNFATANTIAIDDVKTAKHESSHTINKNEFMKAYGNSFKMTILNSIFTGSINKSHKVSEIDKVSKFSEGYKITMLYDEDQVLKVNGEEYLETSANSSPTNVKYRKVVFNVLQDKGLVENAFYIYTTEESYYKVTTLSNFDNLFDKITGYFAE